MELLKNLSIKDDFKEIKILPNNEINDKPITLEMFFQLKVIKPDEINDILIINEEEEIKEKINLLFNNIIPEIKKNKVNVFIIPLVLSDNNIWWSDYANNYLNKFYIKELQEVLASCKIKQ